MACKRDRIIEFIQKQGITVNIGKNKARGNKGFFKALNTEYRIDIAKGMSDDEILRVLVHEFIHYIHYQYDKKMNSYNFLFENINDEIIEELLNITVSSINKSEIKPLLDQESSLKAEINELANDIKSEYSDFSIYLPYKTIENKIKNNFRYLLKYDVVKVIENFRLKMYDIKKLDDYELSKDVRTYILLKSKQRLLKRLKNRISKLNRYYNKPSELIARSFEKYVFDKNYMREHTPILYDNYNCVIKNNKIPILSKFIGLFE